jgi:3-phenylpropionate/trans-cinnamate dioxygenase ferredoxin reductase subunit
MCVTALEAGRCIPMPARNDVAPYLIAGGGLAGGNAAVALRGQGFEGPVALVGREPGVPFGRPPLSKGYLRSEEALADWYVKPPGWYDEHEIERIAASVVEVDAGAHTVVLDSGRTLHYQKLLLATGARNRRFELPGSGLAGIHQLRTLAECDAIRAEAVAGRRALVVGMSFIGCEVAASLTQLGLAVSAILPQRVPLERVLGPEAGAAIAAIHREMGVELLTEDQIAGFEGPGRVETAHTVKGTRLECDLVVAGIGVEPDVPAFAGIQPELSNGVVVDAALRAGVPDLFAAGDVANHEHPLFGRVRVEHFNNAEQQGRAAAASMLGSGAPYDYLHSFWSDQYEHKLEYVGHAQQWDRFVVRGSLAERRFLGFYLHEGRLLAAMGLDRGGDPELDRDGEMAVCARLVAAGARPREEELADEGVELSSLLG